MSHADLIARLEAAKEPITGADVEALIRLAPWYHDDTFCQWGFFVSALQGSVNAAVDLLHVTLPGWKWRVSAGHGEVFQSDPECGHDGFAATPAIALLIATLKALRRSPEGEANG